MLPRIHFHRVRAQYQLAAILERPLLVFGVQRRRVVILLRISKIHISSIRMEVFHTEIRRDPLNRACFHTVVSVLSHQSDGKVLTIIFM
jgi:hypothetical protein